MTDDQATSTGQDARRMARPRHWRWSALAGLVVAVLLNSGCITTGPGQWIHNGFKVGPNYGRPPAPVAAEWIQANDPSVQKQPPARLVAGLRGSHARRPDRDGLRAEPDPADRRHAGPRSPGRPGDRRGQHLPPDTASDRDRTAGSTSTRTCLLSGRLGLFPAGQGSRSRSPTGSTAST